MAKNKFLGTEVELRATFAAMPVLGQWRDIGDILQFHAENKGVFTLWRRTGTFCFQGQYPGRLTLERQFLDACPRKLRRIFLDRVPVA